MKVEGITAVPESRPQFYTETPAWCLKRGRCTKVNPMPTGPFCNDSASPVFRYRERINTIGRKPCLAESLLSKTTVPCNDTGWLHRRT